MTTKQTMRDLNRKARRAAREIRKLARIMLMTESETREFQWQHLSSRLDLIATWSRGSLWGLVLWPEKLAGKWVQDEGT